jgi:hypothetical protein
MLYISIMKHCQVLDFVPKINVQVWLGYCIMFNHMTY